MMGEREGGVVYLGAFALNLSVSAACVPEESNCCGGCRAAFIFSFVVALYFCT